MACDHVACFDPLCMAGRAVPSPTTQTATEAAVRLDWLTRVSGKPMSLYEAVERSIEQSKGALIVGWDDIVVSFEREKAMRNNLPTVYVGPTLTAAPSTPTGSAVGAPPVYASHEPTDQQRRMGLRSTRHLSDTWANTDYD